VTLPDWLQPLADQVPVVKAEHFTRFLPPETGGRHSAVLILFADGPEGPDVLLIERAATLRSHAGQPAFPGGAQDPEDDGPVAAALREAAEEVGLKAETVEIIGVLPALYLPPSGFVVHPVVAWWREPHDVAPVDAGEVAHVVRVPLADLTNPDNRFRITHTSGVTGPAFDVKGLMVWGFTAGLLAGLLTLAGWELPWDHDRFRELDPETLRLAMQTWERPERRADA
jgi:8-oxo-dGTP pyrophosphatase MutT (NUDIX family)